MNEIFRYFIGNVDSEKRLAYAAWFVDNFPITEFKADELLFWEYMSYSSTLGVPLRRHSVLELEDNINILSKRVRRKDVFAFLRDVKETFGKEGIKGIDPNNATQLSKLAVLGSQYGITDLLLDSYDNRLIDAKAVIMKHVFIVNGFPRSGKDTFAEILSNYVLVMKRSSVDIVKRVAKDAGWNGVKDEKGRKLLAALKQALVEYDDLPLKYMASEYEKFLVSDYDVLLLDIREPGEILKAKRMFDAKTVFIENKNISNVYTNAADASIQTNGYDYVIQNNSTLDVFEANIREFINGSN